MILVLVLLYLFQSLINNLTFANEIDEELLREQIQQYLEEGNDLDDVELSLPANFNLDLSELLSSQGGTTGTTGTTSTTAGDENEFLSSAFGGLQDVFATALSSLQATSSARKTIAADKTQPMQSYENLLWPTFQSKPQIHHSKHRFYSLSHQKRKKIEWLNTTSSMQCSQTMLHWLRSEKSSIPSLTIENIPLYGRGIVATEDIQTRTLVSAVPRTLLLRASVAVKSSNHGRYVMNHLKDVHFNRDQAEKIAIAMFLLEQTALGDTSKFAPYINNIPQSLPHMPIFWNSNDMLSLEASHTWEMVMQQRRALLSEYNILKKKTPDFTHRFSFQDWCWSRGIIMTRAFRVSFDFGTENVRAQTPATTTVANVSTPTSLSPFHSHLLGGEVGPSTKKQKRCRNDVLVLSPLADMLNHRMEPNTAWRYSSSLDSFTLYATRDIPKGTPIYDSYGIKTNDALLRTFGFVDRDHESLRTMRLRQADVLLKIHIADLHNISPRHPTRTDICRKLKDVDALLLTARGAVSSKSFSMKHSLDETLQTLFDYHTSVLGTRNDMIALMIRMDTEFQRDRDVACKMKICHFWKDSSMDSQDDQDVNHSGKKKDDQEEMMLTDVFASEWQHVISSDLLNNNQRNGYLIRAEERSVHRFIQRIATQALFSALHLEEAATREREMRAIEEAVAREVLEEMMPVEDQVVAEILNENALTNATQEGETVDDAPVDANDPAEMTVVVEISGLASPSIRLSLPDPRGSLSSGGGNNGGGIGADAYPVLQESLREMERRFVDSSSLSLPKVGDHVLSRCCDTELYFSGIVISSMDDGSHVVQFHSMHPVTSKWTGWLGPIHARCVYYSISPLDIVRLTPKHVYKNEPMAWVPLDLNNDGILDEGRKELEHGQEVFVVWKRNKHRVYFDGNVVLQDDKLHKANKNNVVSIQYNDGDFEEFVELSQIFVRVG
jgi:hypothetical protein